MSCVSIDQVGVFEPVDGGVQIGLGDDGRTSACQGGCLGHGGQQGREDGCVRAVAGSDQSEGRGGGDGRIGTGCVEAAGGQTWDGAGTDPCGPSGAGVERLGQSVECQEPFGPQGDQGGVGLGGVHGRPCGCGEAAGGVGHGATQVVLAEAQQIGMADGQWVGVARMGAGDETDRSVAQGFGDDARVARGQQAQPLVGDADGPCPGHVRLDGTGEGFTQGGVGGDRTGVVDGEELVIAGKEVLDAHGFGCRRQWCQLDACGFESLCQGLPGTALGRAGQQRGPQAHGGQMGGHGGGTGVISTLAGRPECHHRLAGREVWSLADGVGFFDGLADD